MQRTLNIPVQLWQSGDNYLGGLNAALASETAASEKLALLAERAASADRLDSENDGLRALLDLRPALPVRSTACRGAVRGLPTRSPASCSSTVVRRRACCQGAPVIGPDGVIGQVTRVFPLSSQVTLLIDKDAAIPVLNARTQARSAAFGGAGGDTLELRFMAANADVKVGDELITSGVDGVYPPGLAVARVSAVERRAESGFARILLAPSASADGVRHVLVLQPLGLQVPPRETPAPPADKPDKPAKGGAHDKPAETEPCAMIMPKRGCAS